MKAQLVLENTGSELSIRLHKKDKMTSEELSAWLVGTIQEFSNTMNVSIVPPLATRFDTGIRLSFDGNENNVSVAEFIINRLRMNGKLAANAKVLIDNRVNDLVDKDTEAEALPQLDMGTVIDLRERFEDNEIKD
jgi:hypothetical protein